jgi:hypothetical protein
VHGTKFYGQSIRRVYDEDTETWWFSVIDVVQVLTDSENARDYWFKMKLRVKFEDGAELSTFCRQLKLPAADGKQRLTDVATAEGLLRIVQSIPSPKAEPIKLWLAKVGYERMQEMSDPALSLYRARQTWQQHGRSDKWIQQRMTGQETRNKLTDCWCSRHQAVQCSHVAEHDTRASIQQSLTITERCITKHGRTGRHARTHADSGVFHHGAARRAHA